LILIDALFSASWKKKKKNRKKNKKELWPLGFFSWAGHALLAMLCGIFVAFSCY
jgi:hypothetical protein